MERELPFPVAGCEQQDERATCGYENRGDKRRVAQYGSRQYAGEENTRCDSRDGKRWVGRPASQAQGSRVSRRETRSVT